jgi:hypothetical protein
MISDYEKEKEIINKTSIDDVEYMERMMELNRRYRFSEKE